MGFFGRLFGRQERANRRRAARIDGMGARVKIDTHMYPVIDVSEAAIRISGYPFELISKQLLYFEVFLMLNNRVESFPAHGTVLRKDEGGLTISFSGLQPYSRKLLRKYMQRHFVPR